MTGLQARRDALTREEISSAAIDLFTAHGFDNTTMADVAVTAGVSRRTVYRHFSNKEELVFEVARRWMDVLDRTFADRGDGETTRDLCRRAVVAVARHIEIDREATLAGYRIVAATPALRARHALENRVWLERYAGLIMSDIPEQDSESLLHASVVAGALVGGTDGALALWSQSPRSSLVELTRSVLERIEPLWPEESRQTDV